MSKTAIFRVFLTFTAALCSSVFAYSAVDGGTGSVKVNTVSIQAGQTQQFQGTSAISWYVNGVAGGNTVFGKITSSGIYTAPAIAPDANITLTAVDSSDGRTMTVAQVKILDDPAILDAHQRWADGAVEAAATYGCTHPVIQQDGAESVADALRVYVLTADKSSCLILSPVSSDPESNRYSYAWGGNVDGIDIYYISDVSRPRILMGVPAPGE